MRTECKNCKKPEVDYRKGLWSPDEDQKLRDYILQHGVSCWSAVPAKTGLRRNGKSCRLRWINYLRPGLKHGNFSPEEEETIVKLQSKLGNKWSQIAMHLPGRTDNEVKNHWNSYLKKKITKPQELDTSSSASSALNLTIQRLTMHKEENGHVVPSAAGGYTEALESCLKNYDQSVSQNIGGGSPNWTAADHFPPKVLFADCLSFGQANWDSLFNLDDAISNQWHCNNFYTASQVDAQYGNNVIVPNGFRFTSTCGKFE